MLLDGLRNKCPVRVVRLDVTVARKTFPTIMFGALKLASFFYARYGQSPTIPGFHQASV